MAHKTLSLDFECVSELLEDNNKRKPDSTVANCSNWGVNCKWDTDSFYGVTNYKQSESLYEKGWHEGAVKIADMRARLQSSVDEILTEKSKTVHMDVEGIWVDEGLLTMGVPECCGDWTVAGEDAHGKIIKIVANVCVSAAVSHATMFARGAAVVAATDILEALGHRVHLVMATGLKTGRNNKYDKLESFITVKEASQPVDMDRLSYLFANPAFFRRIIFAHHEAYNFDNNRSQPAPVSCQRGTVTLPELCTGKNPTFDEMCDEVRNICELCGIMLGKGADLQGV